MSDDPASAEAFRWELEQAIERLKKTRDALTEERDELVRISNKLIRERDEARRYSCDLEARIIVLEEDRRDTSNKFGTNPCSEIILPDYPLAREPKEIAKQKGWDCFKDNA
jgi:chromosome segregation ATPase